MSTKSPQRHMLIISINSRMTVIATFRCRIWIFCIMVCETAKMCTPNWPRVAVMGLPWTWRECRKKCWLSVLEQDTQKNNVDGDSLQAMPEDSQIQDIMAQPKAAEYNSSAIHAETVGPSLAKSERMGALCPSQGLYTCVTCIFCIFCSLCKCRMAYSRWQRFSSISL